jgi:hypothetical protein
LVAWQHVGVGLNPEPPYRSRRLARPSENEGVRHGVVVQEVDVREGRDELLERAINLIESSAPARQDLPTP